VKASLRTGSTFDGMVSYCQAHGQDLAFLGWENVSTLASPPVVKSRNSAGKLKVKVVGPSNASAAAHILKERCNMFTHIWLLSPLDFGSAQGRRRLWACSIHANKMSLDGSRAHELLDMFMNMIVGIVQNDPNLYLLPCSHSLVRATEGGFPQKVQKPCPKGKWKWEVAHQRAFTLLGEDLIVCVRVCVCK
jgi:hypothetical protein